MKLWQLSEREWALVIENDIDADHPTIKMSTKTKVKTSEGLFTTVILRDEAQARKVRREVKPVAVDWSNRAAARAWLASNDANKTGLTGRAYRYLEWQLGADTDAGRALTEVLTQPWYVARAEIERAAAE